jgi:hypothetical protein
LWQQGLPVALWPQNYSLRWHTPKNMPGCRGVTASNEPPTLVVQPWWLDHLHTKVTLFSVGSLHDAPSRCCSEGKDGLPRGSISPYLLVQLCPGGEGGGGYGASLIVTEYCTALVLECIRYRSSPFHTCSRDILSDLPTHPPPLGRSLMQTGRSRSHGLDLATS